MQVSRQTPAGDGIKHALVNGINHTLVIGMVIGPHQTRTSEWHQTHTSDWHGHRTASDTH
jgi:hypothetical protein